MIKNLIKSKKEVVILGVGKVFQIIIALLAIKLLTTILSEKEVGQYYLLLTILALFDFAFLNPIGQYFGRYVIGWQYSGKLRAATNLLIIIRFLAIICSLIIAFIIYLYFDYNQAYGLSEFLLFIFFSLLSGTYLVLLNNLNTLGLRMIFIKYLVLSLLFGLIFSLLITKYIMGNGMGWLYGIALAQLIFLYPVYIHFTNKSSLSLRQLKAAIKKKDIQKVLFFIVPITITLFLQWGQNSSYRLIIGDKYSVEILAFIAVGFSVSSAIFNAVSSLTLQYFNPLYLKAITNATKENRVIAWNNLATVVFPIYTCLMLFVICLSPYFLNILVADKFQGAYIYVVLGAVIEFFRVSSNVVYMVSQSEVKTTTTIIPYVLGFLSSILTLCFIDFTEHLWLISVVLSLSYCLVFILLYFNMKKILPVKIKSSGIYKSMFLSLPFTVVPLINYPPSWFLSILLIGFFGMYFMFCVYLLTRTTMEAFKE
tara:strand:- start:2709 stop:4154 length:1446 start_codon:yes stop_codon:yes gene_type:complete